MKIFQYIPELKAFFSTPEYMRLVSELGFSYLRQPVWIFELICRDNDFGNRLFSNHSERAAIEESIAFNEVDYKALIEKYESLKLLVEAEECDVDFSEDVAQTISSYALVINGDKFKDDLDGPCHSRAVRDIFWTEVIKNMDLSKEVIFEKVRDLNSKNKQYNRIYPRGSQLPTVNNLEAKIEKLK